LFPPDDSSFASALGTLSRPLHTDAAQIARLTHACQIGFPVPSITKLP
jgi:hypothetical protein